MTCKSIRGFIFGGRHLVRQYDGEWNGFGSILIVCDRPICIRCGKAPYEIAGDLLQPTPAGHGEARPEKSGTEISSPEQKVSEQQPNPLNQGAGE